MTFRFCIQCKDLKSGTTGDFVFNSDKPFHAISPVFSSYQDLYHWKLENGYQNAQVTTGPFALQRDPKNRK